MAKLPPLNALQAAHVEKMRTHLHGLAEQGFLSFERFMHEALYAPGLGYYVSGNQKFGVDFTTAPELTPLFGQTLLSALKPQLIRCPQILELGAGSGALAHSILEADASVRYAILELSPELQARQRERLAAFGDRVTWRYSLPDVIEGAVIANEVLDAVPCVLLRHAAGAWQELGYDAQWQEVSRPYQASLADRLPTISGYTTEINPQAEALVASVAARLHNAVALWCDYGFPSREYYHPDRHMGTVMCHYQHYAHAEPLFAPGVQDLTAHVDFTAMAEAAVEAGAEVAHYSTQAGFLIAAGITDYLNQVASPESADYLKTSNRVNRLLHPAEMGELFKVLIIGRGDYQLPEALHRADTSYKL